jgi:hypothetical protein
MFSIARLGDAANFEARPDVNAFVTFPLGGIMLSRPWNRFAVLLILSLSPALRAQDLFNFTEFSAQMSGALSGPDFETRVYRSGNLLRVDLPGHSIVTDLDKLTSYGLYPNSNACMESSSPQSGSLPFSWLKGAKVDHVVVGEETVEGHLCKVEDVTIQHEGRPPIKLKVWEAQDLKGFPIKIVRQLQTVSSPPRTLFYRDVHLGQPDASVFARPQDCDTSPERPAQFAQSPAPPRQ